MVSGAIGGGGGTVQVQGEGAVLQLAGWCQEHEGGGGCCTGAIQIQHHRNVSDILLAVHMRHGTRNEMGAKQTRGMLPEIFFIFLRTPDIRTLPCTNHR